ncbi:MAG: PadR family transcriptional regulator [Chloroflexota bacterium]|nr:PadR family transcriptional regulator [Chloroflexota bacterium]
MSIKYAILGFLSWRAFTGYELKKLFAESATSGWSGNSNQIYTTLVELHKEGLVSLEIQPQEAHPARKVYTITGKGLAELKSWVLSTSEPPVQKNAFLIQLAWADQLEAGEMDAWLAQYEEKLQTHLLLFRARDQRKDAPQRTPRETYLWNMISQNWMSFYENELHWVGTLRAGLVKIEQEDAL